MKTARLVHLAPGFDPEEDDHLAPLFARSDRTPVPVSGVMDTLASLCGVQGGFPAGALTALGAGAAPGRWLRLDPVHLLADADSLRLVPGTAIGITEDEADALVAHLAVHAGLDVTVVSPTAWLVVDDGVLDSLPAPGDFAGRHIGDALPAGTGLAPFRRWWNEIQMILHDTPVNRRRFDSGTPTINSLWPWGRGVSPAGLAWPFAAQENADPMFDGLAACAEADAGAIFRLGADVGDSVERLRSGEVDELVVYDALGTRYRITRMQRWRFWRR